MLWQQFPGISIDLLEICKSRHLRNLANLDIYATLQIYSCPACSTKSFSLLVTVTSFQFLIYNCGCPKPNQRKESGPFRKVYAPFTLSHLPSSKLVAHCSSNTKAYPTNRLLCLHILLVNRRNDTAALGDAYTKINTPEYTPPNLCDENDWDPALGLYRSAACCRTSKTIWKICTW